MKTTPFPLLHEWYQEALHSGLAEPHAMTLATTTKEGRPSARIVLARHIDEEGIVFYTNLTSRKARELLDNPYAALCFYWMPLQKQIRIEGRIEQVTAAEADHYFAQRPRGSQIGAWASKQSSVMEAKDILKERVQILTEKFQDQPIPRPPFWAGFRVIPDRIEFWQEGEYRLHTRFIYQKHTDDRWEVQFLYP